MCLERKGANGQFRCRSRAEMFEGMAGAVMRAVGRRGGGDRERVGGGARAGRGFRSERDGEAERISSRWLLVGNGAEVKVALTEGSALRVATHKERGEREGRVRFKTGEV